MSGFSASVRAVSAEVAQAVTPSASPFTWTNTLGTTCTVVVSGGAVTAIGIVAGTEMSAGLLAGQFTLRPGDGLKVTYTVAPTMSYVRQ